MSNGWSNFRSRLFLPGITADSTKLAGGVATLSQSDRVEALFQTGSVAEATALVAAGQGAQLRRPRAVSEDGTATAAIAEGPG